METVKVSKSTLAKPQTFFARSAILMAVIVVLSFPLTYFVPLVTASKQFQLLHHVHGLAFFAWIGLYVWQTQLAMRGKMARHRVRFYIDRGCHSAGLLDGAKGCGVKDSKGVYSTL